MEKVFRRRGFTAVLKKRKLGEIQEIAENNKR